MAIVSLSGVAKVHFEAGKNLTIGGELRRKGELVPEADSWGSETVAKLQRTGHLRIHVEADPEDDEGGTQEGAPFASEGELGRKGRSKGATQ